MRDAARWKHLICAHCWNERNPVITVPVIEGAGHCCFCGLRRATAIYVRQDPSLVLCHGRHQRPGACWHEPADENETETICCACGEMIRVGKDGKTWHAAVGPAGARTRAGKNAFFD